MVYGTYSEAYDALAPIHHGAHANPHVRLAMRQKKTGRPTDYKPEYNEQAYKLCLLGATDKELADFFEVTEQTINNWKKDHDGFFESLKSAKVIADAEVADSLNQRARGYRYIEQQAIKVKEVTYENGRRLREIEHVEVVPTERVAPPDTTAAIFWLKNRSQRNWRDRVDVTSDGEKIQPTVIYMPMPHQGTVGLIPPHE